MPFLEETRKDRLAEIERIAEHLDLSLTELLQQADDEIGRAETEMEQKIPGAENGDARSSIGNARCRCRPWNGWQASWFCPIPNARRQRSGACNPT